MDIKEKLFRQNYIFTREDILKTVELFVKHERLNEEPAHSSKVLENRIILCKKFVAAVNKCKFPVLTDLRWH